MRIDGERVFLRPPLIGDEHKFVDAVIESELSFNDFVSPPKTSESFAEMVARAETESDRNFLIIELESEEFVGAINISQIFLKSFRNAYLGYYLFEPYHSRGFMFESLRIAIDYAFSEIGLHRLEANIQPANFRSIDLVKRLGFTREGYSKKYLKIDGVWRDHERWAILDEDFYDNSGKNRKKEIARG